MDKKMPLPDLLGCCGQVPNWSDHDAGHGEAQGHPHAQDRQKCSHRLTVAVPLKLRVRLSHRGGNARHPTHDVVTTVALLAPGLVPEGAEQREHGHPVDTLEELLGFDAFDRLPEISSRVIVRVGGAAICLILFATSAPRGIPLYLFQGSEV